MSTCCYCLGLQILRLVLMSFLFPFLSFDLFFLVSIPESIIPGPCCTSVQYVKYIMHSMF